MKPRQILPDVYYVGVKEGAKANCCFTFVFALNCTTFR